MKRKILLGAFVLLLAVMFFHHALAESCADGVHHFTREVLSGELGVLPYPEKLNGPLMYLKGRLYCKNCSIVMDVAFPLYTWEHLIANEKWPIHQAEMTQEQQNCAQHLYYHDMSIGSHRYEIEGKEYWSTMYFCYTCNHQITVLETMPLIK